MPPKGTTLPSCGFAVRGTKKGDLPLKTEKRARGKKVTLIPNVTGDAAKLARALQTMLGVGGTARRAEGGCWVVEVQGEQIARVTRALVDFDCLQGLSRESAEALRAEGQRGAEVSVVARTAASKFLAQTGAGGTMSPEEERRRLLEMEAEFYGRFWQTTASPTQASAAGNLEDLFDVFEVEAAAPPGVTAGSAQAQTLPELNAALRTLGLLAESGSAVREFWEKSGMTLSQFRREALRFGARLITEEPGRKKKPSNLKSRQKISDLGTAARANYFSCTCTAIDDYQRGVVRSREQREADVQLPPEEPKLVTSKDAEGWCSAVLSYCLPFPVPASRLEEEDRKLVSKNALRSVESKINGDLEGLSQNFPGLEARLDCDTFGVDLALHERQFLHAGRRDSGKQPDRLEKEELKLEKKLREISGLQKRAVEGEALDKLQSEKVSRRGELFEQVAELKLRRAEKDLLKVLKRHLQSFQDAFWDLEWKSMYGETPAAGSGGSASRPFGIFDGDSCEGPASLSTDCSRMEGKPTHWAGARLHLSVRDGEVGAFEIEILEGLARLGWVARGGALGELGADRLGFGFGGTGKKIHAGTFEPYGQGFKAGDVVHCEAEREGGRLRIGFAKNSEPLGVAFDVEDQVGADSELWGAVCGKGFKVRLTSAESMPLEEAPGLEEFVEYDPPRMAEVQQDFREESEGCLQLWAGETVNVSSDNGEGWLFGFFLDPEDPDDGGWFPAETVRFLDAPPALGPADLESPPELPTEDEAWTAPAVAEAWTAPAVAEAAWHPDGVAGAAGATEAMSPVEGLEQWLRDLKLQKYEARAVEWCLEMGAVSLEEVEDEWEDLADALALKPLERKRLAKAAAK